MCSGSKSVGFAPSIKFHHDNCLELLSLVRAGIHKKNLITEKAFTKLREKKKTNTMFFAPICYFQYVGLLSLCLSPLLSFMGHPWFFYFCTVWLLFSFLIPCISVNKYLLMLCKIANCLGFWQNCQICIITLLLTWRTCNVGI